MSRNTSDIASANTQPLNLIDYQRLNRKTKYWDDEIVENWTTEWDKYEVSIWDKQNACCIADCAMCVMETFDRLRLYKIELAQQETNCRPTK